MLYILKKISKRLPAIAVETNEKSPRIDKWYRTTNVRPFVNITTVGFLYPIIARYQADINEFWVFLRKLKGRIKKFCSIALSLETAINDRMQQNIAEIDDDDYLLDEDEEETQLYKGTTIVIDTRQKKNKFNDAIKQGFEHLGFRTISTKLPFGDYSRLDTMRIAVDTKRGLGEIAKNLCSDDRVRFKEEAINAREHGIELIILIIDDAITCIDDVHGWVNTRGQIQGQQLAKTMATWEDRYVHFEFCRHEEAPTKILDLLEVEFESNG